jgi:hypothetical protein
MNPEQAVLIFLDGTSLPTDVYERYDLATLEDELVAALERSGLGEFDGNEVGPGETALYLYGPNAGALFAGIEPVLRASPLCQNARVVIRFGGPGAAEKHSRIPARN